MFWYVQGPPEFVAGFTAVMVVLTILGILDSSRATMEESNVDDDGDWVDAQRYGRPTVHVPSTGKHIIVTRSRLVSSACPSCHVSITHRNVDKEVKCPCCKATLAVVKE